MFLFLCGCSFAQPSAIALHLNKERQKLTFIFFPPLHARSPTLHTVNSASFPYCGGCSIAETPPLHSSKKKSVKNSIFFLRCLGVFIKPHNRQKAMLIFLEECQGQCKKETFHFGIFSKKSSARLKTIRRLSDESEVWEYLPQIKG